jgi:hypothetical protein
MISIAASHEALERTVVIGFNLSDLTWAPENGSLGSGGATSEEFGESDMDCDSGEGRRSFAASQSSSAN